MPVTRVIALVGNPNVGKSTVFNALTGLRQHTGNWAGKTVSPASGYCRVGGARHKIVDLPGTYSLDARSPDEEFTRDYIFGGEPDAIICVLAAPSLERGLRLVLQTLELTANVVVCLNMMDEARANGVEIDFAKLEALLGVPVVPVSARRGEGLRTLMERTDEISRAPRAPRTPQSPADDDDEHTRELVRRAEALAAACVKAPERSATRGDRLDRLFMGSCGKLFMLALLALTLWISIAGANYPSRWLASLFALGDRALLRLLAPAPAWLRGALLDGVYRALSWVVSVMLPPMAIFFPIFTLLEDFGVLPRIAFNLDGGFERAHSCGKQALTMCMGLGCNAAGVTGCRIIDSPRERLVAILTNSLVPCNGRFPALVAVISMFFASSGAGGSLVRAGILALVITLGVALTLLASRVLSATALRGESSSFALELPPYRVPKFSQVITRSLLDRTLFVLGRAAAVAAPAGLLIWITANVQIGGEPILRLAAGFLDPFARALGLDGVILFAFILGFPANEIVVPLLVMGYLGSASLAASPGLPELRALLLANGWSLTTAVCVALFTLAHWPCSTTCLTIRRETGSAKWTLAAIALPTLLGMAMCAAVKLISTLF
ncbi:MAG: ferrous iron transporter B [Oscillospiraceae bacterium]|jgi:ferrous iron transport protein B|nr:ferrous iron transporter B [Oscillospiraceae bacterium]